MVKTNLKIALQYVNKIFVGNILLFIIVISAGFTMFSSLPNNRLDVKEMPLIHKVDERFMSFQIGMSHLTGGETWKTFDSSKKKGEGAGGGL